MKIPTSNNESNGDSGGRPVTMADVREAEAQAARSQQQAVALRERLEAMEDLLAATKSRITQTNRILASRDERLNEVNQRTKELGESVHGLESRFETLKQLQGQLAEKRETLINSLEASLSEAKADAQAESDNMATDAQKDPIQADEMSQIESETKVAGAADVETGKNV